MRSSVPRLIRRPLRRGAGGDRAVRQLSPGPPAPLSDRDAALELAWVEGLPFVGLRHHKVDTSLFAYIPFELARQIEVLPIQLLGNRLRLASAGLPVEALERIQSCFPRLRIELVIAPGDEIECLLDDVQAATEAETWGGRSEVTR